MNKKTFLMLLQLLFRETEGSKVISPLFLIPNFRMFLPAPELRGRRSRIGWRRGREFIPFRMGGGRRELEENKRMENREEISLFMAMDRRRRFFLRLVAIHAKGQQMLEVVSCSPREKLISFSLASSSSHFPFWYIDKTFLLLPVPFSYFLLLLTIP